MSENYPEGPYRPVYCANCGTGVDGEARFCPTCGRPLPEEVPPPDLPAVVGLQTVEYMGFWIRVLAWLVDTMLLGVLFLLLARFGGPVGALGVSIIAAVYYVLFTGLRGQTIGKMVMGIQVVNSQGQIPGIGRAALREVVGKFVSGLILNLGYLWVGWDSNKRGWHDHIGGTFVVRKGM